MVLLASVSSAAGTGTGSTDSGLNTSNLSSLELEDEEDWLTGLQSFINDVTSSGATVQAPGPVPQGPPSSGPSLSVVTDAAGGEVRERSWIQFSTSILLLLPVLLLLLLVAHFTIY